MRRGYQNLSLNTARTEIVPPASTDEASDNYQPIQDGPDHLGPYAIHMVVTSLCDLNNNKDELAAQPKVELSTTHVGSKYPDLSAMRYQAVWQMCAHGNYKGLLLALQELNGKVRESKVSDALWGQLTDDTISHISQPNKGNLTPFMMAAMNLHRAADSEARLAYNAIVRHLHALNTVQIPVAIKQQYLKQSDKFPAMPTRALSGRILLPGGYVFKLTLFVQAKDKADLLTLNQGVIPQLLGLSDLQDGMSIKLFDHGMVYLPRDHTFSLHFSKQMQLVHMHHADYFKDKATQHTSQASSELPELTGGGAARGEVHNGAFEIVSASIKRMINAYVDNLSISTMMPSTDGDHDQNYKQKRMALWASDNAPRYDDQAYWSGYRFSDALLFANIEPYKPTGAEKFHWFGPVLTSLIELVYTFVGAYLVAALNAGLAFVVYPLFVLAIVRRALTMVAHQRELTACRFLNVKGRHLLTNESNMIYFGRILRGRNGIPCDKLVAQYHCHPGEVINSLVHYTNYSKLKGLARITELTLIWVAFFNGLVQFSGSAPLMAVGATLGLANFFLRYLLDSPSSSLKGRSKERLAQVSIALFYGVCYVIKDLIAAIYAFSFYPDCRDYFYGKLTNATKQMLLNSQDPWAKSANETFDIPLLNNLSLASHIALFGSIIFFDILYYVLVMARSPYKANPRGSRRFGNTWLVDVCGKNSIAIHVPFDFLVVFPLQSAEMLFGVQLVLQVFHSMVSGLPEDVLLALVFTGAPIAALVIGAVMAIVNSCMSCYLCRPQAQPWILRPQHTLFKQGNLQSTLNKVYFDLLFDHANGKGITNADGLIKWLNGQIDKEVVAVLVYLQSLAIASNWQTMKKYMAMNFPLPSMRSNEQWHLLYRSLLKMGYAGRITTQVGDDRKATWGQVVTSEGVEKLLHSGAGAKSTAEMLASVIPEAQDLQPARKMVNNREAMWRQRTGNGVKKVDAPTVTATTTESGRHVLQPI